MIPAGAAATLRGLTLLDTASGRLVYRAAVSDEGVVLTGYEDDFDELIDCVATEANYEQNRRRQKHLDAAFEVPNDVLTQST